MTRVRVPLLNPAAVLKPRTLLGLADAASALAAPFAAAYLRDASEFGAVRVDLAAFAVYAVLSAAASFTIIRHAGCARVAPHAFGLNDASRVARAVALGILVGAAAGFACTRLHDVARAVPFIQAFLQVAAFVGTRMLAQRITRGRAAAGAARHVLVIGSSRTAISCFNALRDLSGRSIAIAGFLTDQRDAVGQTIGGEKILGTIADIENVLSTLRVHGVEVWRLVVATREDGFTAAEAAAVERADRTMACRRLDAYAILADFAAGTAPPDGRPGAAAPAPFGERPAYARVKRAVDVACALGLLVAAAPLMLVLCAVVALDAGMPILFWQRRLGRNGVPITIYKFRTMGAPLDRAGRLLSDAQRLSAAGRWMRKLHLDELPQLLSILRGDMSFVGPRPLLPADQPRDARGRLSVRPGLTGWAQVHGGALVDPEDKNALDLWYVAHAGLLLDAAIAARTLRTIVPGDRLAAARLAPARRWFRARAEPARRRAAPAKPGAKPAAAARAPAVFAASYAQA